MTAEHLTALRALEKNVAAGVGTTMGFEDAGFDGWAELAYHGSLDAAKALHDAVLPGWWFAIQPTGANVGSLVPHDGSLSMAANDNPARAWLLAIILALIWQEENRHD